MSWLSKQLKFRDLKKVLNILDEEVGDKLDEVIIAVDLEELLEDIIHRVIVECITSDPLIVARIEDHIRRFLDRLDG